MKNEIKNLIIKLLYLEYILIIVIKLLKITYNIRKFTTKNKKKYFLIGSNKTGTTSIAELFRKNGFLVANQKIGEIIYDKLGENICKKKLFEYIQTADLFQDVPFSTSDYYKDIFKKYPNEYYILSLRKSEDTWYKSQKNSFMTYLNFPNGNKNIINAINLFFYNRKGWPWNRIRDCGGTKKNPIIKKNFIKQYVDRNQSIRKFFNNYHGFFEVVIDDRHSQKKLINFLKLNKSISFPFENKNNIIFKKHNYAHKKNS